MDVSVKSNIMIRKIITAADMASIFNDAHDTQKIVFAQFMAEWCSSCTSIRPYFDKIAHELSQHALYCVIDIDKAKDIAVSHVIQSVPTIVAFQAGKELARIVGIKTYKELREWVEALLAGSEEGQIILRQQLFTALQQADVDAVKKLVEKDVNVVVPFENQLTPLLMALFVTARIDGEKATRIIELLLHAGAEWDTAMANGKTLLEFLDVVYADAQRVMENYRFIIENIEQ